MSIDMANEKHYTMTNTNNKVSVIEEFSLID